MKIAIFSISSPSGISNKRRAENALKFLKDQGHELVLGELFWKEDFYRSGSIKARIAEFNHLLAQNCDLYLCAIGGYCASSTIAGINYQNVKSNMVFVGHSDAAPLLLALSHKTNAKVLYGPNLIAHFGEWEKHFSIQTYQQMIKAINPQKYQLKQFDDWSDDYKNWEKFTSPKTRNKNVWFFHGKGIIKGNLIGGNLNAIIAMLNSDYCPKIDQKTALFIEDSFKSIDVVEKLFGNLIVNNLLQNVQAIILGKYEQFDDLKSKRSPIDLLLEIFQTYNLKIPFVYNIDCGHTHPTNCLILNQPIFIDFDNQKIIQNI